MFFREPSARRLDDTDSYAGTGTERIRLKICEALFNRRGVGYVINYEGGGIKCFIGLR